MSMSEQIDTRPRARALAKEHLRDRVLRGDSLEYLARSTHDFWSAELRVQMGGYLWPLGADVTDPSVRPRKLTKWQIGISFLGPGGEPCIEIFSLRELFAEISIEEAAWQGKINGMTTKELAGRLACTESMVRSVLERLLAGQSDDTRLRPCSDPKGVVIAAGLVFTSTAHLPDGHPLREPGDRWVVLTPDGRHCGAEILAQGAGESGRNAR
jgi:hypothetical protein